MVCGEYLLPSGNLEFWYALGRGCLPEWPQINTMGAESPVSFPSAQHFMRIVTQFAVWGVQHILCDPTGRRPLCLEANAWFPPDFFPCTLPSPGFAPLPFTVINHSCQLTACQVLQVLLENYWTQAGGTQNNVIIVHIIKFYFSVTVYMCKL